MRNKNVSLGLAAALAMFAIPTLMTATPAAAQAEKVLHSFGANSKGGFGPASSLTLDSAGNLYGTTFNGGNALRGTVYELSPKSGGVYTEKVLYSFSASGGDAQDPEDGLIFDSAGNLYGAAGSGGSNQAGAVFELSPPVPPSTQWTEKLVYSFLNNSVDGRNPAYNLISDSAGNLYGITLFGGAYGFGTVFELSPTAGGGWIETVLHSFDPNVSLGDGTDPRSGLTLDSAGKLYGTTRFGGSLGSGTVYKLTPSSGGTWTETILYNFANNSKDGGLPVGGVIFDSSGNLYGTTTGGGPKGGGTVFKLTPSSGGSWTEAILHYFLFKNSSDGSYPYGNLTFDSVGDLYGTTLSGGTGVNCTNTVSCGVVYELRPASGLWSERLVHNFTNNGTDGYYPEAGVIFGSGGSLYGTTYYGGTSGEGTVFTIKP
jgi:uncharacterized repeat protein (TIGR03803 family)